MAHSTHTDNSHQRPEIPSPEELKKLPKDGGEKWNRLVFEQSPYLLQHAANPVNWYPWGDEAFEEARKQDKPIFLSIGYSTCHWCHVMEHESFENEEIGKLINDAFIPVKVDREERPDIDATYMAVTLAMNGQGGWPMTVLLTPDKEPFFAATYLPPESLPGRMGMRDFAPAIKEGWQKQREDIIKSAREITDTVAKQNLSAGGQQLSPQNIQDAFEYFSDNFDSINGGMSTGHHKFPSPHQYIFLLRNAYRFKHPNQVLEIVEKTLQEMAKGGIFDHVGYGFHRYATDEYWLLPHFEKMLYDQAMISYLYLEAYEATRNPVYSDIAEKVFEYVLRDMTSPEGGFYSAEDADSEGKEGKFYVWTFEELKAVLTEEAADIFAKVYLFAEGGNFRDESTHQFTGENIPHLRMSLKDWSEKLDKSESTLEQELENIRQTLFEHREKRIHPYKDDKILTDWNGLMIAALAKGARVLNNEEYQKAAINAAEFILDKLQDKQGNLLKRYREGQAGLIAHLDDYAYFSWGLLELFETTQDTKYLEAAVTLTKRMVEKFADPTGGFYLSSKDSEELIFRTKDGYDGATPSGNSVAAMNLIKLATITGDNSFRDQALGAMEAYGKSVERHAAGFCYLLTAFDFLEGPSLEIVFAGEESNSFNYALEELYLPRSIRIWKNEENSKTLANLAPFTENQKALEGKTTAYICENYACQQPQTDPDKAKQLLLEIVKPVTQFRTADS